MGQKHGGGFYVSTSPVDTQRYGDSLTAGKLTHETLVLGDASDEAQNALGKDWDDLIPLLRKVGVSMIDDPQDAGIVWHNDVNAAALGEMHVVDTPEMTALLGDRVYLDGPDSGFPSIAKKFPNLVQQPGVAAMLGRSHALQAAVAKGGADQAAAFATVIKDGETNFKLWAIPQLNLATLPAGLDPETVGAVMKDASTAVRGRFALGFGDLQPAGP